MKKLLLITQYFPPSLGGIQRSNWQIVRNMPADHITVLTDNYGVDSSAVSEDASYTLIYKRLFSHKNTFKTCWLSLFWHSLKAIIQVKPQVIWASEILPIGLVVYIFSFFFSYSYFMSAHGLDILSIEEKNKKSLIPRRWLLTRILKKAAFITVNSEYTRQALLKYGIQREQLPTVYPSPNIRKDNYSGQQLEKIIAQHKTLQKLRKEKNNGTKILLSVGRLVERKGFDKTIEAMQLIKQSVPDSLFVIAGDGPQRNELEKLAVTCKLQDTVLFVGKVSDEVLAGLYEICDVFTMVSRQIDSDVEGFGVVYVEAASFGKPVIGAKSGGITDAVREYTGNNLDSANGLLVNDPTNVDEIAESIITLFTDSKLSEHFGKNGINWSKKFTWEGTAAAVRSWIQNL